MSLNDDRFQPSKLTINTFSSVISTKTIFAYIPCSNSVFIGGNDQMKEENVKFVYVNKQIPDVMKIDLVETSSRTCVVKRSLTNEILRVNAGT